MRQNKIKLHVADIIEEIEVCPYCMHPANGIGCCGESSAHFEVAYDTGEELYLKSEVEVIYG
jgi:hypothetical protein